MYLCTKHCVSALRCRDKNRDGMGLRLVKNFLAFGEVEYDRPSLKLILSEKMFVFLFVHFFEHMK